MTFKYFFFSSFSATAAYGLSTVVPKLTDPANAFVEVAIINLILLSVLFIGKAIRSYKD